MLNGAHLAQSFHLRFTLDQLLSAVYAPHCTPPTRTSYTHEPVLIHNVKNMNQHPNHVGIHNLVLMVEAIPIKI